MKKFVRSCLLTTLVAGFFLAPTAADPSSEAQAVSVSQTWLKLVDADKLDDAYATFSTSAKKMATKDQFVGPVRATRKKIGSVISRSLKSKKFMHNPPSAPPGDYVIIEYNTKFSVKGDSVERVTPTKDPDGKWRVSGYYLVQ